MALERFRDERREEGRQDAAAGRVPLGGVAGWLLSKLRRAHRSRPRLALVERITLAPRQSLSLIEAEGRRLLVATSADGASAFYPLDEPWPTSTPGAVQSSTRRARESSRGVRTAPRISW